MLKSKLKCFLFGIAIAGHATFVHADVGMQPTFAAAQQQQGGKVIGTVTDEYGAVAGASVLVKGTTNGTVTDAEGKFAVEGVRNGEVIQVAFLGYDTQEIVFNGQKILNVQLKEDAQALEEVVVVGYGVQKKRDLTGAVTSIKMADEPVATFSTISHALAGKAAGLRVTQSSAQVGGGTKLRIRGETSIAASNDPLVIVDGFPISAASDPSSGNRYDDGAVDNVLASINPNDIESIEVLKDASATAIYGSRAGHGVIIVTTKRGKQGDKVKVSYSGNMAIQNMKNAYQMLDAKEYMNEWNAYYYEDYLKRYGQGIYANYITPNPNPPAFVPKYSDQQINNAQTTDWFGAVTRTGVQKSHNVSATGGSATTQYLASVNFFEQQGVVQNNNLDRLTVNLNLDQQVSKYVKTGLSLNLSRNTIDNVPLGDNKWENAGVIVAAVMFSPAVPVYDENGDYSKNPDMGQIPNPVSLLDITDKTTKDRVLGSAYLTVEPTKGLILKASLGVDRQYAKRKNYLPTTTIAGAVDNGRAYINQEDKADYLMELTANYTKTINNHSISALAGYSYQEFNTEGFQAGNIDFPIDGFLYNNLGAGGGVKPTVGSSASKSALGSYFGRINYSFLGKYLLTATVRADGASNFNPDYRWGAFPSASLGWRFSDENFWSKLQHIVSNGKLRGGYGQTGNSSVGNRILDYYGTGSISAPATLSPRYVFGNTPYVGVWATQLGNPRLTWETTSEVNIGLDLSFLKNRINASIEYYDRTISDLLVTNKQLPTYNELTTIAANIGKTQGQGLEITINTINIDRKNLFWSSDLSFSTYKDRWKERDPDWTPAAYQKVDDPIRAIHVYTTDGLLALGEAAPAWQQSLVPGQIKINNLYDEDGSPNVLNQYDRILLGSEDPAFTFGFNNTLKYKRLDLNVYFYGEVGRWRGASYYDSWVAGNADNNVINLSRQTLNSWSPENQSSSVPSRVVSNYGTASYPHDYYYEKINFVRCRNITLGYAVPIPQNILPSLRVYADVNNPFVFTNYNGVDPETDSGTYNYPNVTTFSFGVDITF
jgi:TonB-linked SusC/RagA family outer membrane protein